MLQMYSKALVILPYLSVVAEKTEHLTGILRAMRCKVKGYMGNDESGTALSARYELLDQPSGCKLVCQLLLLPCCMVEGKGPAVTHTSHMTPSRCIRIQHSVHLP